MSVLPRRGQTGKMLSMMLAKLRLLPFIAAFAGIALQAGCKSKPKRPAAIKPMVVVNSRLDSVPTATPTASVLREQDILASKDRCAGRLHDLEGAMLMYFAIHKQLPQKLDDLRSAADIGQQLEFACPESGAAYVYDPRGLELPGREERLLIYDSSPAHAGGRWGIIAGRPRGRDPAAMWVVRIPEAAFQQYHASPAAPAASDQPAPAKPAGGL